MTSDPPRVSVVMPAYNAAEYVSLAIASVLNQSFADFELIVVEDGCTDATSAIVGGFDDARLRFVRTKGRVGPAAARNVGLGLARSTYVAFLDADDLSYPHRLATQFTYMEAHPNTALLGAGYDVVDSEGTVLTTFREPSGTASVRLRMLFDNVIATSLAFARRDVLVELGLFDGSLSVGEDHDMWARIASRYGIANLAEVLGAYRDHSAGTYHAGRAVADAMRARVVRHVIKSCLGVQVSHGTAMVLSFAATPPDCALEDSITALALLEALPRSPVWLWADDSTEQRAVTRAVVDKLAKVVSGEPGLHRHALRAAASVLREGESRGYWDRATLRSLVRLVLAPGGRARCRAGLAICRRTFTRWVS